MSPILLLSYIEIPYLHQNFPTIFIFIVISDLPVFPHILPSLGFDKLFFLFLSSHEHSLPHIVHFLMRNFLIKLSCITAFESFYFDIFHFSERSLHTFLT